MNPVTDARNLLAKLSITDVPTPLDMIANSLGLKIFKDQSFEDSISGVFVPEKMAIIVNASHPEVRQRFTIAHEIGHFILHYDPKNLDLFVDKSFAFYRNRKTSEGLDDNEKAANKFAAELLMPEEVLRKRVDTYGVDLFDEFSVSRLATAFNVSEQAMTLKLQSLDVGIHFI